MQSPARVGKTENGRFTRAVVLAALLVLPFLLLSPARAEDPAPAAFPRPASLEAQVHFWKRVFTQVSTSQFLIHDRDDVRVVYDVLDLEPEFQDGVVTSKVEGRVHQAKEAYAALLLGLAPLGASTEPRPPAAERVLALLGCPCSPDALARAAARIRAQQGLREKFAEGVVRARKMGPHVAEILRRYGVPEELAALPLIESTYNPHAVSKAGATGIWQFTRATGKRFMQVSRRLDQRLDPIRSTHAAARLLRENYEALGNWPLAITAYNYGQVGMMAARTSVGSDALEEIIARYNGQAFGFAVKNFYAEFLAALDVARESGWDPSAPAPPGPLPEVASVAPAPRRRGARLHRVRAGETLWDIARAYRADIDLLRATNKIHNPRRLRPGQSIIIPGRPG